MTSTMSSLELIQIPVKAKYRGPHPINQYLTVEYTGSVKPSDIPGDRRVCFTKEECPGETDITIYCPETCITYI